VPSFYSPACSRVKHLKGVLLGYSAALLENIRLGWKGLPGIITLAYYENSLITDVKSFITLVPCLIKR
jgi:hypothetical protein